VGAAVVLLVLAVALSGCSYYSFSGATIPSHLSTIAIPPAQDNSVSPVGTLGQTLTDLLADNFVGRTKLSLTTNESNADATLEARIVGYQNEPRGVSGEERATVNRVTIRIQVRYYDQVEDREMLSETVTGFGEYDPVEAGLDGERQAAQTALERAADNIFTNATSNW
jgi:hypothetical protein